MFCILWLTAACLCREVKGFLHLIISSAKTKQYFNWIGEHVSSPEQRLLLGATALATQPFIDYNNKNVDENTRMISVARTLAKIVAGTVVGVAVRVGCIAIAKKYGKTVITKLPDGAISVAPKTKSDIFAPKFDYLNITEERYLKREKTHRSTMGTILATGAMMFTNFLVDAPLTRFLTGKFSNFITQNANPQTQEVKK